MPCTVNPKEVQASSLSVSPSSQASGAGTPGGVPNKLFPVRQLASEHTNLSPHSARLHRGLPTHVPPHARLQIPSFVHPISALGFPPANWPPRHRVTVPFGALMPHTVFGASPKQGPLVLVDDPPSHCSPVSDTPSPHIGFIQLHRHASAISSRLPSVSVLQLPPVQPHSSMTTPPTVIGPPQSASVQHSDPA